MNNYEQKAAYCTIERRNCVGCDQAAQLSDCRGNQIEYCLVCNEVIGINQDRCLTCWEIANPGYCIECGQPKGRNAENDCFICREHVKDREFERAVDRIIEDGGGIRG